MTVTPDTPRREITAEEARRVLVARLRHDQAFTAALIADPAVALAGVNLRALFNIPEEDEVQGYRQNDSMFSFINYSVCC
jgi:hypothetical protein